jgi:hypothetical protein
MSEFTVKTKIDAPPETVAEYVVGLKEWCVTPNSENAIIETTSNGNNLKDSTQIRIEEKIRGTPEEAVATGGGVCAELNHLNLQ